MVGVVGGGCVDDQMVHIVDDAGVLHHFTLPYDNGPWMFSGCVIQNCWGYGKCWALGSPLFVRTSWWIYQGDG
jgi:hypothetical protein